MRSARASGSPSSVSPEPPSSPSPAVGPALATVSLKKAAGSRFENPGPVWWAAITLEGYRQEQGAVANLAEVLARCGQEPKAPPPPPPPPQGEPVCLRGRF